MKRNVTTSIFSERIKMACKHRGIKQSRLAEACGVTPSAICQFARGRNAPRRETLIAICKSLSVSSDFLFGLKPTTEEISELMQANQKITADMATEMLCRIEMGEVNGRGVL